MVLRVIWIILFLISFLSGFSQSKKSKKELILFTVENKPVMVDEFIYLFKKNHPSQPEKYTEQSILEYFDLFVNFKLKVNEAKHRGMDTTTAFVEEFTSYRNELLKPYLPDAKIVDSLVALTYSRLKEEVRASHILITLPKEATPSDTLKAFNTIMELRNRAVGGEDFGSLAENNSNDPSAKTNKGDLGYFTALQMVYPFENAAYNTPVGEISKPIRTQFGYHLVKVVDKQSARGDVEVSHIMLRNRTTVPDGPVNEDELKNKIFDIHDQLVAGASWDELCRQYSEDQSSKDNGGKLRPFGVGAMAAVPEFEQAAFSLEKPGDISDPFKTAYGWHIVKLEKKSPLPPYEELAPQLKSRVSRDERLTISKQEWQDKFKKRYQFIENSSVKSVMLNRPDSIAFSAMGKAENETLFSFQGSKYTIGGFLAYARKKVVNGVKPEHRLEHLYNEYVDAALLDQLQKQVSQENPEFGLLIREYYEGILLFEIMEQEVWNRAAADSSGQLEYYTAHQTNYEAGERLQGDIFSGADKAIIDSLRKMIDLNDTISIDTFVKKNSLRRDSGAFEKADRSIFTDMPWATGIYSIENNGMYYLAWIYGILPPGSKTFDEARAAVIADYQQELEKEWVSKLKKKYPVKINEKGKKHILSVLKK